MKILIIGSGGREHALAWNLRQSPTKPQLYALPGSSGIGEIAECLSGDPLDTAATVQICRDKKIDLVVIGPEAPLAAGLSDALQEAGIRAFGPKKEAAQLESSKSFAKAFMRRHSIPTASYETFDDPAPALDAATRFALPFVVKADGLAAGKGVRICRTRRDAIQAVQDFMVAKRLGTAGMRIVLEEYLDGAEITMMAFCDGQSVGPLPISRDYKRLLSEDRGPNTGGMGAFAPVPLSIELRHRIRAEILDRTLCALQADDLDYCGILYCGLMLTKDGPKVLEYNTRFGDPETQAVLPLLETDLLKLVEATVDRRLADVPIRTRALHAAAIVLASEGYPSAAKTGRHIHGLSEAEEQHGAILFHAGTNRDSERRWTTSGGRVLDVAATGHTLEEARNLAYRAAKKIHFEGMQCRDDIAEDPAHRKSARAPQTDSLSPRRGKVGTGESN